MGEVILYFLAGWGAVDIIGTISRHIESWSWWNHRNDKK